MQLTTENLWITKLATKKNIVPRKYPQVKLLNPRNTQEKNLNQQNNHEKKFQTHKTPIKVRWRDHTTLARPKMAHDIRNLADSIQNNEQN